MKEDTKRNGEGIVDGSDKSKINTSKEGRIIEQRPVKVRYYGRSKLKREIQADNIKDLIGH